MLLCLNNLSLKLDPRLPDKETSVSQDWEHHLQHHLLEQSQQPAFECQTLPEKHKSEKTSRVKEKVPVFLSVKAQELVEKTSFRLGLV